MNPISIARPNTQQETEASLQLCDTRFLARLSTIALLVAFAMTACGSSTSADQNAAAEEVAASSDSPTSVASPDETSVPNETSVPAQTATVSPEDDPTVIKLSEGEVDFGPFIAWLEVNRGTFGASCKKADPALAEPAGLDDRGPYSEIEELWPLEIDPEYRVDMCGISANFQPELVTSLSSPLIAQMSDEGLIHTEPGAAASATVESAYPPVASPWWPGSIPLSALVAGETYCKVSIKGVNDPTAKLELGRWPYVVDSITVDGERENWGVFDQFSSTPIFLPVVNVNLSTTTGAPEGTLDAGGTGLAPASVLGWNLDTAFYSAEVCE